MQVKLKVLSGSSAGRELKIPSEEFLIGRSDACQLRPKSDSISRKHCILRVREGRLFAEDLGSRNGTFVDGQRLTEETELQHGNMLRLGRLEFEVVLEKTPPAGAKAESSTSELTKTASSDEGGSLHEDSAVEDNDITKWLEEGDTDAQATSRANPRSRAYRADDTERLATETTVMPIGESDTKAGLPDTMSPPSASSDASDASDASDEGEGKKGGKEKKKQPGKLPPRPIVAAGDSRQAASDMLKRFFNRP
jgi:pSer/pThr/pTyr-binding forkhead associated (FHA) protein